MTMRGVEYRNMAIGDLAAVRALALDGPSNITARKWDDNLAAGIIAKNMEHCFVAARRKQVLGYIIASMEKSEERYSLRIHWLGVMPQAGGETVSGLLKILESHASSLKINELTIELRADSETEFLMMEKSGFSGAGSIKIMRKSAGRQV
jgi:hypothetical protein